MDLLNAMRNFTAVVDARSFSHAAVRRRLSNAAVSQSIKNLEDHLGVRLLNRNTRAVTLTDEGQRYDERCRTALAEIEAIQSAFVQGKEPVCGRLCIEVPYAIGKATILPHLARFTDAHPGLELTVLLNSASGRVIEEGIDVAVQLGTLASSTLISRKVYAFRHLACATPTYLRAHGSPASPAELRSHRCIGFWSPHTHKVADWVFVREGEQVVHKPQGPVHFNSSEAVLERARAHGGIVYLPDLLVRDHLRGGDLVALLEGWSTLERPVHVVFPAKRHLPAKVRAFADFIGDLFASLPS
ncbi:MAG: LysR family transcriptional regulator [Acetobacteraceae bacterium]